MNELVLWFVRRFRPSFGWLQAVLGLGAALCPALAAEESSLKLASGSFALAGLAGFGLGLLIGKPRARAGWLVAGLGWLVSALLGVLLLLALGGALPPLGLLARDGATLWAWGNQLAARTLAPLPELVAPRFFEVALPRLWQTLRAAPAGGENGARLLAQVVGTLGTGLGALLVGRALANGGALLGWGLPLLATLVAISTTGAVGWGLGFGLTLLLLLAILANFRRGERGWQRAGIDYSDQIERDVASWGGAFVGAALVLALLIPTTFSNPIADLLWRDVELPSGIAVLNRPPSQPRQPTAQILISGLPAVQLGVSLEQQAPERVALRVRVDAPLPESSTPRYWRVRLLERYNGRQWSSGARIGPPITTFTEANPEGFLRQEIEDARPDRGVLAGLADVVAADVPATTERLPDGTLAALTSQELPERYTVFSVSQRRTQTQPEFEPPPDMGDALALPPSLPPRVGELARAITGGSTGSYEQALALETYLRDLPYSYEVAPVPGQGDAVDQFLFDMRQGYCTYYASSMVVLARSLGIPARLAIGYAQGAYDPASQTYTVHEADAHAWPELYIDGSWQAFEPTPVRALPARNSGENQQPVESQPLPEPTPATPLPWPWLLALGALVVLAGVAVRVARRGPPLAYALAQIERAGARAGLPWPAGATLREYAETLGPALGPARSDMPDLVGTVERARYRGIAPSHEEAQRLLAATRRITRQLVSARRANRR